MKKFEFLYVFLIAILLLYPDLPVLAGEEFELDLFRPQVGVTGLKTPKKDFEDVSGDYSSRTLTFDLTVPIGKSTIRPEEGPLLSQVLVKSSLRLWRPDISFLNKDRRFYQGNASVVGLFIKDLKNFFLAAGGASFAEDEDTLDEMELRPSFLGMGVHKMEFRVALIYGAAFSYVFGRGTFFPILGLSWKMTPDWTLTTILPLFVKVTHPLTPDLRLGFILGVTGDRTRFDNDGAFPGRADTLHLRVVKVNLGTELNYKVTKDLNLFGEAGILGGRKLTFLDGKTKLLETDIDPAVYIQIGMRYSWGETILDQFQ